MSDAIRVTPTRIESGQKIEGRSSIFPNWSLTPEAKYKKAWLPGTITAPPGFDAVTTEERFSLRDALNAAEVISFSEWSRQLAEILYLKRDDGDREELLKADREALILWMAENPTNPLVDALLDIRHPILFRNPFPGERILITQYLGCNLQEDQRYDYDLGYAVGRMVDIYSPDQNRQIEAALSRRNDRKHCYYWGLFRGLNIIKCA